MLSASKPYKASGSSAVPVIRVSIDIFPEPAALPFTIYLFNESNVPNAQVEISPAFGAVGFTYSRKLKSAEYFRSPKLNMPWDFIRFSEEAKVVNRRVRRKAENPNLRQLLK